MHYILALLAIPFVAATTLTSPMSADSCSSSGNKQVCCDGQAGCLVQVIGDDCAADAYCCKTGTSAVILLPFLWHACRKLTVI